MARTTTVWLSDEMLTALEATGLTPVQAMRRGLGLDGSIPDSVVLKRIDRLTAEFAGLRDEIRAQTAPESTLPLAGYPGVRSPSPSGVRPPAAGSASQYSPLASFDPDEEPPA